MIEYTGETVRPPIADQREHRIYNSLVVRTTLDFLSDYLASSFFCEIKYTITFLLKFIYQGIYFSSCLFLFLNHHF